MEKELFTRKDGQVIFKNYSDLMAWKSEEEKHNGWTNYATWRIYLECLEGEEEQLKEQGITFESIYKLSQYLEERVSDIVIEYGEIPEGSLAVSYADAFISQVNFYEIAENMVSDNPELIESK